MGKLDPVFRRPRTWCGLLLCLVGVVASRMAAPNIQPLDWANVVYLSGIALAMAGLALTASAIQVSKVNMVACPECLSINPVDAIACGRCKAPLNEVNGDYDREPNRSESEDLEKICAN